MCRGGRGCAAAIHHAVKASIRTAATAGPPQPPRRGAAPRRSQPLLSQTEVNLALSKLCLRVRGRSWATWHHPSGTTALSPCWWHRVQVPQGPRSPPETPRCPRSRQELPWRCWQRVREGWGCARQHPSPQLLSGNGQQADWGRHRVACVGTAHHCQTPGERRAGIGMGTGSSAPRAPAEPVPSLWDAPGCVPPTQDGRKTRGSALSCKARRIPLALFAACWPRAIAPHWLGGGGRGGDRPSPGCWHSREPGSALLPLAEHADLSLSQHFAPAGCSKGLGGAAADGQPDPFPPPHALLPAFSSPALIRHL